MAKPQKNLQGSVGEIIENPIYPTSKKVLMYWSISSPHTVHVKVLPILALKTADAGYLNQKELVDVAQDMIITEDDCGTLRGLIVQPLRDNDEIVEPLSERILGRVSVHDLYDPVTDQLIVEAGSEIDDEVARIVDDSTIEEVEIRSVLTCELVEGYVRNVMVEIFLLETWYRKANLSV